MRSLKGEDVFPFLRVIKASNAHAEMTKLAAAMQEDKGLSQTALGMQFLLGLINNCATKDAEEAIWTFLSGPTEKTPEELKNLDLDELFETVEQFVQDNIESGNMTRFFSLVRKLMPST